MRLYEVSKPNTRKFEEAMWWVQRFISGQMTDPDWEEQWLYFFKSPLPAFQCLNKNIKVKTNYDILFRALDKSQIKNNDLLPHKLFPFQQFTTNIKVANEFKDKNKNAMIISLTPHPEDILFSYKDLLKSKNEIVIDFMKALGDWEYQNEVLIKITSPTPINVYS